MNVRKKDASKAKQHSEHAQVQKSQKIGNDAMKAQQKEELDKKLKETIRKEAVSMHFPPLFLVISILVCSGFMWMVAFRDMMATGKSLFGPMDDAFLAFTKSTFWFNDSKGWKSSAGGLSAVQSVTTDANKMGDLFVRKLAGVAALGFYTQKLYPFVFHPNNTEWGKGHFFPLLKSSMVANLLVIAFFSFYFEDLKGANASRMSSCILFALSFESIIMLYYILLATNVSKIKGIEKEAYLKKGKNEITSRIVMRTVVIVSGVVTMIAGRDLFIPGHILSIIPRDDIYLEWTGAFIHSPPLGSPEEGEYALESALHIGDKFSSQLAALYILILCLYKFTSAVFIRYGVEGKGEIQCKMIWRVQSVTGFLIVAIFRLFTSAALSASLDLRWHLMCLAYEAFILGLYGFW